MDRFVSGSRLIYFDFNRYCVPYQHLVAVEKEQAAIRGYLHPYAELTSV